MLGSWRGERMGRITLTRDARYWRKLWSVWLQSIGVALLAIVQYLPESLHYVWIHLPGDIKSTLPDHVIQLIGLILIVIGGISRFIKQKRLDDAGKTD